MLVGGCGVLPGKARCGSVDQRFMCKDRSCVLGFSNAIIIHAVNHLVCGEMAGTNPNSERVRISAFAKLGEFLSC